MFEWLIPSMKAIYNSRIVDQENIQISITNRGFCYGDGLFETIVTGPERINLVDLHINRLRKHCGLLSMEATPGLFENLKYEIERLTVLNGLKGDCRTKVMVWRAEGGLYSATNHHIEYLITQRPSQKPVIIGEETIGISQKIHNHYSVHSVIKSMNALDYVIAGNEMRERGLDEIIILDQNGNLSETHIGNLFWIKDEQIFTPALSTGCIDGVMRGFLIDFFEEEGMSVKQVRQAYEVIENAQSIFSTNASGITYFSHLEGINKWLDSPNPYFPRLIKRLQQP
jgi:branched-subunit amino acid aminotransferase/4-amino-4-deoxychorismate lyase